MTTYSRDRAVFGDVKVTEGSLVHAKSATIARANSAAKTLFTLPANAIITGLKVSGAVGSDAGTTATIKVGKSGGTGSEYLTAHSVVGAAGVGTFEAPESLLGTVGTTKVTVTGTYAETGTASTTGGPFTVVVEYTT